VPKFIVPVENLPPPNEDGRHIFRIRVLSQDRNRSSQYSTLYSVLSTGQIHPLQSPVEYNIANDVINVYWETPSIYNIISASVFHNHESEWRIHDSDIFVSFDGDPFEYYGRSRDNQIGVILRSGASSIRVVGQVANYPPKKLEIFQIFDTGTISLV
jgi:hypothetical protein